MIYFNSFQDDLGATSELSDFDELLSESEKRKLHASLEELALVRYQTESTARSAAGV